MKTSIKDIPVANERLLKETTLETKEEKKTVDEVIKFVGTFIADTIANGMMEGVMIPEFGKFQPKKKLIAAKNKVVSRRQNGMDMLVSAIKGKNIVDNRKPKDNETI